MDQGQAWLVALVAVGGGIGSLARWGLSGLLTRGDFPWGTFAVNVIGTFLLAFLYFLFLQRGGISPEARSFLFVGVFGGFTTFSTFGLETVTLARAGSAELAIFNVLLNGGLCVAGAFAGALAGLLLAGGGP